MNANFDGRLNLTNGRLTVAARGPCIDWLPDDRSAEIKDVTITQGGVVATTGGSTTVQKAAPVWALDASSSSQLKPGRADAWAHVTVTKIDGSTYPTPCYFDVVLLPATP